jgi:hypothetical protein
MPPADAISAWTMSAAPLATAVGSRSTVYSMAAAYRMAGRRTERQIP